MSSFRQRNSKQIEIPHRSLSNTIAMNSINAARKAAAVPAHATSDSNRNAKASRSSTAVMALDERVTTASEEDSDQQEDEQEIEIAISNVVCSFSVCCHLNLRQIALNSCNVEYHRDCSMVTMKLRKPNSTASIWSSGRVTCTGATSEEMAKQAARRYARCLQKLGYQVCFQNFHIVNVLGTCRLPWAININNFAEKYKEASYEPELHPGVTFRLRHLTATLKIFSTGSVTVTGSSVPNVQGAVEYILPLITEFATLRPQVATKKRSKREVFYLSDQDVIGAAGIKRHRYEKGGGQ